MNVEHPQHLSHIYDTLTFIFECWGWGGGGEGVYKKWKKILPIQK